MVCDFFQVRLWVLISLALVSSVELRAEQHGNSQGEQRVEEGVHRRPAVLPKEVAEADEEIQNRQLEEVAIEFDRIGNPGGRGMDSEVLPPVSIYDLRQ